MAPKARAELGRRIALEWPVYVLIAITIAVFLALIALKGVGFGIGNIALNIRVYLAAAVFMLGLDVIKVLIIERPPSPVLALRQRYVASGIYADWASGLPMLLLVATYIAIFSQMKAMIPLFNDYTWDKTFIAWDRAILFGSDAWQVMQPILGHPLATFLISLLYNVWILLLYVGCIAFAVFRIDEQVRRAFFLTFILSWSLIGVLLATFLASVGPYFLQPIVGDAHFAAQVDYLHRAAEDYPILSLPVQDELLHWYLERSGGLGSGITAMPSMHVSIAFLFYLATRRLSPRLGKIFLAFLIVIIVGSVHLAYHYLVDAIVSIVVTAILWRISCAFVSAFDRGRSLVQADASDSTATV